METPSFHIKDAGSFHIKSFNYAIKTALLRACLDMEAQYCDDPKIKITISNVEVKSLQYPMNLRKHKRIVYPSEARLRAATYYAELHLQFSFESPSDIEFCERIFYIPLMVKSDLCFLSNLDETGLIKVKEDIYDPGGYFIIKGKERVFRQFIVLRRNYPLAISKTKWKTQLKAQNYSMMKQSVKKEIDSPPLAISKTKWKTQLKAQNYSMMKQSIKKEIDSPSLDFLDGECKSNDKKINYSEFGVIVRSVKDEHNFSNFCLHFLTDGTYDVRIYIGFRKIHIPVMLLLKALEDEADWFICQAVLKFYKDFPIEQLKTMLRFHQDQGIITQNDAKIFIGQWLQELNIINIPDRSYQEITDYLFRKYFIVHLDSFSDKFEFLCFSMCKLYCVVSKKIRQDDLDNPVFQEILAPGQIYLIALKNGITSFMKSLKNVVERSSKKGELNFSQANLQKLCNRAVSFSSSVATMLATGNIPGKTHGLMTETGYTIALKRTNVFELAAQFNSVIKFHLAKNYNERKGLRRLYPEAWGFLCPVQTPEGEMTGIYNQLASGCKIVNLCDEKLDEENILRLGVLPTWDPLVHTTETAKYFVIVDGNIIGWIYEPIVTQFLLKLKLAKETKQIPPHTEIVFISENLNLFPGIYLFSTSCRMVRRILNSHTSEEEIIGCFEQVFLNVYGIEYTEPDYSRILSLSAGMIPYYQNNFAVRNIFSSVKCKQALGLPFYNLCGRADVKTQQLIQHQTPLVNTELYNKSGFNLYPNGTNVIIAILSYTGYDMEDALVLNKAAVERGMMQSLVYKTIFFEIDELAEECGCLLTDLNFSRNENDPYIEAYLDVNGFPFVGREVNYNDPILCVQNKKNQQWLIKRYLERCSAHIYSVKLTGDVPCGQKNIPKNSKKISITYIIRKIPEVGDKFTNRHGGKGICSMLMCPEDLPFSEDGMVPDVICNPHSLPSRMSIGLFYEIEAAKVALSEKSLYTVKDVSTGEKNTYDTLGKALEKAGLSYYGTQKFYSGTSGEELEADVFFGCLYYLRLHHLVDEKYQVRSVGPVDEKTYQPINPGRSGAIRVGEMERDAILSHGAMELIMDRLLHNSDKCYAFVCTRCKSLLYPILQSYIPELRCTNLEENAFCNVCDQMSDCRVQIPYVLVYLLSELSVMKIKVQFSFT